MASDSPEEAQRTAAASMGGAHAVAKTDYYTIVVLLFLSAFTHTHTAQADIG